MNETSETARTPLTSATTQLKLHAALSVVGVLFGANSVIAKLALREVSALDLVVIRTWGAAAFLFSAVALRSHHASARPKLTRSDIPQLLLYSLLGASVNQICFLEGLARSTATNASLILVTTPVLTLGFALLLRRERVSIPGVAGIALGLTGALLLIIPSGNLDVTSRTAFGNLLLLLSAAVYALYLVLTRSILARLDPVVVVSWVFLLAAVTVLPVALLTGGLRHLNPFGISPLGLASIAYVIIGGTALPYLINNWALVRVRSSIIGAYVLLQPLVTASLGRMVLHEQLGPHAVLAAILVVAGLVLSTWRRA